MDLPEHADSVSFSLRHGDVVLAYVSSRGHGNTRHLLS